MRGQWPMSQSINQSTVRNVGVDGHLQLIPRWIRRFMNKMAFSVSRAEKDFPSTVLWVSCVGLTMVKILHPLLLIAGQKMKEDQSMSTWNLNYNAMML